MTFDAYESSALDGTPVELFLFVRDGVETRLTSHDIDYEWGGETWTATPMQFGEIEQSESVERADIPLQMPMDHPLALSFLDGLQEATCSLTVWRGHAEDPDQEFLVDWKGRVVGGKYDLPRIELTCENVLTRLKRRSNGPRYSKTCSHALYSTGCGAVRANYATFAEVTAVAGSLLTVPDAALQADGYYTGGIVEYRGVLRWVLAHTGETLLLTRPIHAIATDLGEPKGWGYNWGNFWGGVVGVGLYPGCDRTIETCETVFDNRVNHLGFVGFPQRNPLDGASII